MVSFASYLRHSAAFTHFKGIFASLLRHSAIFTPIRGTFASHIRQSPHSLISKAFLPLFHAHPPYSLKSKALLPLFRTTPPNSLISKALLPLFHANPPQSLISEALLPLFYAAPPYRRLPHTTQLRKKDCLSVINDDLEAIFFQTIRFSYFPCFSSRFRMIVTASARDATWFGAKRFCPMPFTMPASAAAAIYGTAHAGTSLASLKVKVAFGSTVIPRALTTITANSVRVSSCVGRKVPSS